MSCAKLLLFLALVTVIFEEASLQNLIWQEEFDYLNLGRWEHLITAWRGGNAEFQYYTNRTDNSYVRNGILYIRPTLTSTRFGEGFLYNGTLDLWKEGCNIDWENGCRVVAGAEIINPIQSARIRTKNSFSFTYGRVEVRAKMPRGDWLWPAIWMLPSCESYGPWPRSGEIDIVETRGNNNFSCNGGHIGNRKMDATLHWGPDAANNAYRKTSWSKTLTNGTLASDFHVYRVDWNRSGIFSYLDGAYVGGIIPPQGGFWQLGGFAGTNIWAGGSVMAPFDKPFHLVLNVAAGGNYFPDGCNNVPFQKPWTAGDSQSMKKFWEKRNEWLPTWDMAGENSAMQIDYIRVYSL